MKRLNFKKRFKDLSIAEKSIFYDNVRKTVFRYISNRAQDDELAYEVINDAYMKALDKADEEVTIRSLRSYIGTIAWHALYHRKIKKNPYVIMEPNAIQRMETADMYDNEQKTKLPAGLKESIKELTLLERRRLRDLVNVEDYKKLENIWGMSNSGVRQVVFKLRKKIKSNLKHE